MTTKMILTEIFLPPQEDRPVFALAPDGKIFEVYNNFGGEGVFMTDGYKWIEVSLEDLKKYERLD